MDALNVFKYYSPIYNNQDNLSFFSNGELYFQQPAKFNDPWDCKAPRVELPNSRPALKNIWDKLSYSQQDWLEVKHSNNMIKNIIGERYQVALENIRHRIGVCSLSFIPDNELMWSHYSKSHTGYMLNFEFDISYDFISTSHEETGIPLLVDYQDKIATWRLLDYYDNKLQYILKLIRNKSSAWSYEHELRLLNTGTYGLIKAPNNWLKSIVIGLNTENELSDKLKQFGNDLNVPVFTAEMSRDEFKVIIPGLNYTGDDGRSLHATYKEAYVKVNDVMSSL